MPLMERLALEPGRDRVIALAGAGGKTTLLYALGRELARRGYAVGVSTTTHIFRPEAPDFPVMETGCPTLLPGRAAVAGTPAPGGKLSAPAPGVLEEMARRGDFLLVEADGSRRLPIKFPRAGEPVLPACTDRLVVVAGLSALGQPLGQCCHRAGLAQAALGTGAEEKVTPELLARLLILGYGNLTPKPWVLLNQADTPALIVQGEAVKRELLAVFPNVVILSLCQEGTDYARFDPGCR